MQISSVLECVRRVLVRVDGCLLLGFLLGYVFCVLVFSGIFDKLWMVIVAGYIGFADGDRPSHMVVV